MFGLILLIAVLAATAYIGRKEQLTRAGGDNSVLAGVCGGIADRYKLPPLAVRAVFAVLAVQDRENCVELHERSARDLQLPAPLRGEVGRQSDFGPVFVEPDLVGAEFAGEIGFLLFGVPRSVLGHAHQQRLETLAIERVEDAFGGNQGNFVFGGSAAAKNQNLLHRKVL